jgi:hypothetical protein
LHDEGGTDEEKPGEKRNFKRARIAKPQRGKTCTCQRQGTTLSHENCTILDALNRVKKLRRAIILPGG